MISSGAKTASSNKKSIFDEQYLHRPGKGSLLTTGSSSGNVGELISHYTSSFVGQVNKDSFLENFQTHRHKNKNASVGNLQDMARVLFPDHFRTSSKDVAEYITSQENEESNETVIVNENKENDEYIKKLCAILNENLENAHQPANIQNPESLISPIVDKKNQLDPKFRHPIKSVEKVNIDFTRGDKKSQTRRLIDFSQSIIASSSKFVRSHEKNKEISCEDKDSFLCEQGSPDFYLDTKCTPDNKDNVTPNIRKKRHGRTLSSGSGSLDSSKKASLKRQSRDENLEKKIRGAMKEMRELNKSSGKKERVNKDLIQSLNNEINESSTFVLDSIPEEEEGENAGRNMVIVNIEKTNFNRFITEPEEPQELEFITDSDVRDTPRYSDLDFRTHYTPGYSERLYTVEEVCSPSKESSTNGELHFRMFNSGELSHRNVTNSIRRHHEVILPYYNIVNFILEIYKKWT